MFHVQLKFKCEQISDVNDIHLVGAEKLTHIET